MRHECSGRMKERNSFSFILLEHSFKESQDVPVGRRLLLLNKLQVISFKRQLHEIIASEIPICGLHEVFVLENKWDSTRAIAVALAAHFEFQRHTT